MPDAQPDILISSSRSAVERASRLPGRRIAYIADPCAVTAAATLFGQKHAIQHYARGRGLFLDGYVVDSGTALSAAGLAFQLHALVCAARRGEVDAVVVEHVSRFAPDYALALRIAAALTAWGTEVHEALGGAVRLEADLAARLAVDAPRVGRDPITVRRGRPAPIATDGAPRRRGAPERVP